jgi:hypothetical protein
VRFHDAFLGMAADAFKKMCDFVYKHIGQQPGSHVVTTLS